MSEQESELDPQLLAEMTEVHLQRLFKKITLVLGRVFYLYPVPDEAVWDATRCLDNIFRDELGIPPQGNRRCHASQTFPGAQASRGDRAPEKTR